MGCHLFEVLIPAVVSALLLWEGVQCRKDGYDLIVPSQVTVQHGLSRNIYCRFTYRASHGDRHAPLYGYWYVENKRGRRPRLVATNDPEKAKEIDPRVRRRFEVSGPKLNVGDCSLTINDAEVADQATYHFRMEKGSNKYSYSAANESSTVIVTERKVSITVPGPLRAGQRESIFCKIQRSTHLAVPQINWIHTSQFSVLEISRNIKHDSLEGRMDFIPTEHDDGQNITCKVTYGEESSRWSVEKTVTLNVQRDDDYHPMMGP